MSEYVSRHSQLDTQGYVGFFARAYVRIHTAAHEGAADPRALKGIARSLVIAAVALRAEQYKDPRDTPDIMARQCNAIVSSELTQARVSSPYPEQLGAINFTAAEWSGYYYQAMAGLRYSGAPPQTIQELLRQLSDGEAWHTNQAPAFPMQPATSGI